jgi:glycosyltransferase involved in cell wall biosynthesis
VGAKRPHKNAVTVIDALAGTGLRLVVTGYRTPYDAILRERAQALSVTLELPEWIDELDDLYARAGVVVVPSLYEGFGLPVLEAMARGVPVVCSNRSSLPEVAGDAAVLVDPTDPDAIRRGIERALANAEELRAKGLARAAEFTWERCAAESVSALEQAVDGAL